MLRSFAVQPLCFLITAFFAATPSLSGQEEITRFSPEEIQADLDYLYTSLIEAHYDLYANTTEHDFAAIYRSLSEAIPPDSISTLEATNIFQQLAVAVNNGHTEIDFPVQAYIEYAYSGGTLFPLEIAFENDRALVRKNFSNQLDIPIGAAIVSIDGEPIEQVLARIAAQVSGERPYFKMAKIEAFSFPRLYWQVFGTKESFQIDLQQGDSTQRFLLPAVPVIEGFEMRREEVLNAAMSVDFFGKAAYLNPGDFGGELALYEAFIDSAFTLINQRNSPQLIIDLRNNKGGDDSFSDYLVAYIADRPFQWNASFTLKTSRVLKAHTRANNDTTLAYFRSILDHADGVVYAYPFDDYLPQSVEDRFTGEVFVLVNRQSHSQATVTAAQIQDYGFGTIVGEETAEHPTLHASQFQYPLPHTGIQVKVSKGRIVRVNGSEEQVGVRPDIVVRDHLLDETDEALNFLLQVLAEEEAE